MKTKMMKTKMMKTMQMKGEQGLPLVSVVAAPTAAETRQAQEKAQPTVRTGWGSLPLLRPQSLRWQGLIAAVVRAVNLPVA